MKKFFGKAIIVFLAVCMLISSAACGKENGKKDPGYIVKDGKSDYSIIIPKGLEVSDDESFAASELRELFFEATGIMLEIKEDGDLVHNDENKYFSVGNTTLLKSSGIEKDETLTYNGFQLITKGNTVYFIGKSTNATINSVYDFLERTLDFDQFTLEIHQINKVKDLELPELNVRLQPDISYQEFELVEVKQNRKFRQRMRLNTKEEIYSWTKYKPTWVHNTFGWYPPEIYNDPEKPETYHPKFYGANGQQLCYNANGDPEELKLMKDIFVEMAKEIITANPDRRVIGFTHEDQDVWCKCEKCKEADAKYKTGAGVVIQFLNDVAARLEKWVGEQEELKGNTYEIMFFAYNPTVNAPAHDPQGDGTYEPIDSSVKGHPWVAVMLAPILSDQYISYDSPGTVNEPYRNGLLGWSSCCDNIYLWVYNYSYIGTILPFSMQNSTQKTKKFFLEHGLKGVFEEYGYAYYGRKNTAFFNYTVYLQSKVNWNLDLDLRQLTEKYFNGVYGEAAEPMKKFYDAVRMNLEGKYRDGTISGDCWSGDKLDQAEAWPYGDLVFYMQCVEEAYEAIKDVKTLDPDRYEEIYNEITLESLFPRYCIIDYYGQQYSSDKLIEMKLSFKTDAENLGVRTMHAAEMSGVYEKWGI